MNREERRREEKLRAKKAGGLDGQAAAAQLRDAQMHHQAGRLDEAEREYLLLLDHSSIRPEALHGLGLLNYRRGKLIARVCL